MGRIGMAAQQSFANVANVMANTAKTKEETKLLKQTGNAILPFQKNSNESKQKK